MAEVRRVGVIGAGTMGAGIAQVVAQAGLPVRLYDVQDAFVQRGLGAIRDSLDRLARRERLSAAEAEATLGRITPSTDLANLADVDFVVEAAPERLELKREVFASLDRVCRPEAILASNTSSLSITEIAAATTRPQRVVGMHFFNPPVLMALVEVARAAQSDPASVAATVELTRRIGKMPVEVADTPGFIVNRVARPFYLEGLRILGEGLADVATIDRVLELGGFRMGPFRLMDLVGIDVNFAVTSSIFEQSFYDARYRPHLIQQQLVRANRLGRKNGRGFYEYGDGPSTPVSLSGGAPATGDSVDEPDPLARWKRDGVGAAAVIGDGELAASLRTLIQSSDVQLTDDLARASVVLVAGLGPLEVRRLGVRDALRQAGQDALILAHCAPYPVTEIAAFQRPAERVVGFTLVGDPAEAGLVEVAGGLNTKDEPIERGLAFFRALGKEPVRVGDGPGMILLRVVSALANEAASALDDGVATAEGIDTAMKLGVNYPFGPLEWADRLGLDLVLQTMRALQQEYGDRCRPAVRLRRLVQAGRLGCKSGGGFF